MPSSLKAIQDQINKLQAQADDIVRKNASRAIAQIKKIMAEYKITPNDLFAALGVDHAKPGRPAAKAASPKVSSPVGSNTKAPATTKTGATQEPSAAKYKNPQTGATWSGRGKPPTWIANDYRRGKADKYLIVNQIAAQLADTLKAPAKKNAPQKASAKAAQKPVTKKAKVAPTTATKKPSVNKAAASKKPAPAAKSPASKSAVKAAMPGAMMPLSDQLVQTDQNS